MKVLIALDHSTAAQEAARTASDLLAPMEPEFIVLNVCQVPITWVGAGVGFGAIAAMQLDALGAETATLQAKVATTEAERAGVPDPEVEVATGDVVHEICAAARLHAVDLIVVGSHDRPLLSRLLEPSTSRGVLQVADRPVLVVPERAA